MFISLGAVEDVRTLGGVAVDDLKEDLSVSGQPWDLRSPSTVIGSFEVFDSGTKYINDQPHHWLIGAHFLTT